MSQSEWIDHNPPPTSPDVRSLARKIIAAYETGAGAGALKRPINIVLELHHHLHEHDPANIDRATVATIRDIRASLLGIQRPQAADSHLPVNNPQSDTMRQEELIASLSTEIDPENMNAYDFFLSVKGKYLAAHMKPAYLHIIDLIDSWFSTNNVSRIDRVLVMNIKGIRAECIDKANRS